MGLVRVRRPVLIVQLAFIVLFLLFLVYVTFFADWRPHSIQDVKQDLEAMGVGASLVAILFQAVATVLLIPGFILILATALVFGFASIWISLAGQTLGTILCYLIARHIGRDPLHALLGQRMVALERAIEERGFRYLLILRTLSLLPTPFVVYAPGLVKVKFRHVVAAAVIGQIPFVLVFAYLGRSLSNVTRPTDLLTPEILFPLALMFGLVSFPLLGVTAWQRYKRRRIVGEGVAEPTTEPPES